MNDIISFFKDKHGNWTVIQVPNPLLSVWLLLVVVSWLLTDTTLKNDVNQLKNMVLFTWAYLEFTGGTSYFRRTLGTVIMIMVVAAYFV